jgi:hypothetical protein
LASPNGVEIFVAAGVDAGMAVGLGVATVGVTILVAGGMVRQLARATKGRIV